MLKKLHLKSLLLLAVMLIGGGSFALAEESTSTLTFTAKCNGSGTADDGVKWTVTSDGTESNFDNDRGIHYGTNNAAVTYITLTTSGIKGTIKKIVVNAAAASTASVSTTVGSSAFGGDAQALNSSADDYTFNGSASGEIVVTVTKPSSAKKALYVKSIAVTYEKSTNPLITANDVDLAYNATSGQIPYTITNPSSATLTAAKTTGGWISNVAVDGENNKVTFDATENNSFVEREGTITLSYAGADDKVVTITQAAHPEDPSFTLDFTSNDWGFSVSPTKTTGTNKYTNGATIELSSSTADGNGYYFDTDNLMLGKKDAFMKLPVFPFNVRKIKVYGDVAASGSVTFNIFVDDEAVSDEATSAKVTHTFNIDADKQASGTVYTLKVTNAYNTRISKIEVFGYENVPVGEAGFATYCSPNALDFSVVDGLTAYTASLAGDIVSFDKITKDIPKKTGVLVKGVKDTPTTYNVPVVASSSTDVSDNALKGVTSDFVIDGKDPDNAFYVLKKKGENVGFYKVISASYTVRANSAYLALPAGSAKEFIGFGDETAVEAVAAEVLPTGTAYNLQGQRVGNDYKGVVIVNGKKVIR